MFLISGFIVYNYQDEKIYSLNGSYQGEVLNKNVGEVGFYTINFEDEEVSMFSAVFKESFVGGKKEISHNEYELDFDDFSIHYVVYSDDEIQVDINEKDYVFHKKSDVPIWENLD